MRISKIIITVFLSFLSLTQIAQTTIVLQPGVEGKDSNVSRNAPYTNYGSSGITIFTWTNGGALGHKWALLEFDLSSIPENAVITNALLSLYFNPTEPSESFDFHYGDNAAYIQRITFAWEEYTVNWDNQPSYTTQNQVSLAASSSPTQDYLDIDVTALVNDMINDNNGFIIKMQNEKDPYRGLLFASGDHPNAALHPKLVITYTDNNEDCITLKPGAEEGKDTFVWSLGSNDYGDREDMNVYTWTNSGSLGLKRALIEFDLSEVPDNVVITNAFLSIYYNPTDAIESFDSHFGDNAIFIRRITSGWSENTINWDSQPTSTSENQISLPASTSSTQDYLDIDVTNLVNDMIDNNHGFIIRMQNESDPYRGLLFASSDHSDSSLHPELKVCWRRTTEIKEIDNSILIDVYPNPGNGVFNITLSDNYADNLNYRVFNVNGKVIQNGIVESEKFKLDIEGNYKGIYFLQLFDDDGESWSKKIILY